MSVLTCVSLGICAPVFGQEMLESDVDAFAFREIGPSATGGRIVDVAVDPRDSTHIYAASASGGLWFTENNGTTWDCIFQNEDSFSIGDIAIDPSNPDTIWVGTGEANNQRSSYWGDGVYKSTDAGATWVNMGLPESHHIGRIIVHPDDSNLIYVAALGHLYSPNPERGLYRSRDGGLTWDHVLFINEDVGVVDIVLHPTDPDIVYAASYERRRRAWDFDGAGPGSGIWRSKDSGESWERLTNGLPDGNIGRIGIDVSVTNPDVVFAAVSNQNTFRVPAQTFDPVPDSDESRPVGDVVELPRLGVALAFEDGNVTVSALDNASPARRAGMRVGDVVENVGGYATESIWDVMRLVNNFRNGDALQVRVTRGNNARTLRIVLGRPATRQVGGAIYRSDNAGDSWVKVNEKPVGGTPAYYYGQIRVDPSNDDNLYVLSVPLFVSEDGGVTWNSGGAPSVHVDHHAFWINPEDPSHLILGNDGGMHFSHDKGATWDHVFNLPLAQFYAIGADMQQPYHVYGGLQDNGTYAGPSQSTGRGVGRFDWYRVGGGDGFYSVPDPTDHNIVFAESQFGYLYRLDKRTGQRAGIRPPQSDPAGPADRYNWMSPIVMSHHNPRTIYFGGNKLFKSYNRGDDWIVISPDLSSSDPVKLSGNVPHCTITTVSESPLDQNSILAGTDDGNVHWTRDGGKTWTNMSSRFPLRPANWWVSRVELSHVSTRRAYVTFTGYREDDFRPFVYVTDDSGATWRSIASNLPRSPINVIREDSVNPDVLWVGTEHGVFVSINRGEKWQALDQDVPTVAVHDLLIHPRDRDLIIGTHGRGMFVVDVGPIQELTPAVLDANAHLFSIDDTIQWQGRSSGGISGDRKFTSPNPARGALISYRLKDSVAEDAISLHVENESGTVVAELATETDAGLHRVNWTMRSRRQQIAPGIYTAVLKVDDGVYRQQFEVMADPVLSQASP